MRFLSWVEFAYRLSTYAILSSWIEDKTEETTISMKINLMTSEVTETRSHKAMRVPKKHHKATKSI